MTGDVFIAGRLMVCVYWPTVMTMSYVSTTRRSSCTLGTRQTWQRWLDTDICLVNRQTVVQLLLVEI